MRFIEVENSLTMMQFAEFESIVGANGDSELAEACEDGFS